MSSVAWVWGDSGGPLEMVVTGQSASLAGSTVAVLFRNRETGIVTTLAGTVEDAANGVLRVSGSLRSSLADGVYLVRVRVTYPSTAVDLFPADNPDPELVVRSGW
jgi:hypothetical protein